MAIKTAATTSGVASQPSTAIPINWRVGLAIAVTVFTWASAFAGIQVGLQAYSPQSVALLRYIVASFALLLYALMVKLPLPRLRDLPRISVLGVVGVGVYAIALNAGEQSVSSGVASMIVASAPVYVSLLSRIFLKERYTRWAWVGILACFSGVALIAFTQQGGFQLSAGAVLIWVAASAQSLYIVGQKPLLTRYSPVQFTTYAIWAATAVLLIFLPELLSEIGSAPFGSTAAVAYLGVFPGAIGYVSWAYVLSKLPASRAGGFLYLVPATAILIAWVWLGEIPAPLALIGGGLILVGVIVINRYGRM